MFDSDSFTQDALSNPTKLMKTVVDAMERADTTGQTLIADPNNGFVMQLSASLAVHASMSQKIDNIASFMYPSRSRNAEQLYPHLSEYDYVKLMAAPATVPFVFAMDADWIRANAVYYDTNYNRLLIPETSYLTMGSTPYSMYYPIEILVNRNTGAITALYDGSYKSNLFNLESNMLLGVEEFTQNGLNWFRIMFNMYQFRRETEVFTVGSEQGFIKTLNFEDQFYAVKVHTQNADGSWKELSYSLSKMYYDYRTPTAILTLLTDRSQININIPQIYFDNGQISKKIRVEMYTTKGKVNYSLSLDDVQNVKANFDTTSSVFAGPMEQMPSWDIVPRGVEVVGGSNMMSYFEIRDAVVNQRLSDRVAVTTPEIIQAFKKAGFSGTRVKDDLTERVYFASNVLTDAQDMVIPTFTGNIFLAEESLKGNPSTIISHSDGYYTIQPTTTFTIAANGTTCLPMTDSDVAAMNALSKVDLVKELNKGSYVRQPFHITLKTDPKSPQAMTYNLMSPKVTLLTFNQENPHSAPQMSVIAYDVVHNDFGTGGYTLTLGMTRSINIEENDINNFIVIVSCLTSSGEYVYLPASFIGVSENGLDTWQVALGTNYHIDGDDFLTVDMYNTNDELRAVDISLKQDFVVTSAFVKTFEPTIPVDASLNMYLPPSYRSLFTGMTRQTMSIALGNNLSSQIYCGVNTSWGSDVYKTAEETVYYKTNIPVFQKDPDTGGILTRYNEDTNTTDVVVLYPQGTTPSSTEDLEYKTKLTANVSASATTVIKMENTIGVLVGMKVRGTNIPVDSKVTIVTNDSVTLSTKITQAVQKSTELVFTNPHPEMVTIVDQSALGDQLSVGDTGDLIVGQSVMGFDLPPNVRVKAIVSQTVFTITAPTTVVVKAGTVLTFINKTAPGVVKTAKGDVVQDATGKAIVVKKAQNQYLIPAILLDGRLFASEDPMDQQIITTITDRLNNFANQISTLDAGLIESSDVYYKPARSMGLFDFEVGGGRTKTLSLGLGFDVTVYVDNSVYNTQTLLSSMDTTIITTINQEIQKDLISVSDLTDIIDQKLGSNAAAVEMGPISGIEGLRLVSIKRAEVKPGIEQKLFIENDGHIKRRPNITITYVPKPDTTGDRERNTL